MSNHVLLKVAGLAVTAVAVLSAAGAVSAQIAEQRLHLNPVIAKLAEGRTVYGLQAGIEISIEALTSRAARLPRVDIEQPRSLIGKSTETSIQSGIVYGFAGQVDGICRRRRAELGDELTTIATGGLARVIVDFTETIDLVDDLLTLKGLRLIHERNR